ncbi:MAG TPA: peptidylprolyl isomerase, partial [Planctomycetaceae bacterium]|nr:peptidylprolyl isomerase [Planctomycetaceae bacterium]
MRSRFVTFRKSWMLAVLTLCAWCLIVLPSSAAPPGSGAVRRDTSTVLVTVNGTPITQNQLTLYRFLHKLPREGSAASRKADLEQLVENELMRQFLADRRAEVDPKRLAAAVKAAKEQLKRDKRDPDKLFQSPSLLDGLLRRELSLPMAWQIHLGRVLTPQAIRDEYDRHRSELDGTEVRASQIFLKLPATADAAQVKALEEKLAKLRAEIIAGKISFADAARHDSEAPSAAEGGDVGWFAFRGKMPPEICRVVFGLKVGEVSAPFRTKFGMHLYTMTQIRPGNLSLEDVRTSVIGRFSRNLWDQFVGQMRKQAKIDWNTQQ